MSSAPPSAPTVARPERAARKLPFWHGFRFRDALLISVVPLVALALMLGWSVQHYLSTRAFDDWWSRPQSVAGDFNARARSLLTLPTSIALREQLNPDQRDAGIIRLEVPAAAWDSIEGDGQKAWGTWVNATLRYGETQMPVKIRKRGDNSIHWLTDKRTITVKTPRDDFYKRYRVFGLSVKDVLPAYLSNRLAQEFHLVAPTTMVVPVYLNNRFAGMYRFVEPVDESFLRPFDRMPGNIFRGDAAERSEYRKGVPRNVFENPDLWDRASANDRPTSAGAGQLRLLVAELNGTTFDDHQKLMRRLEREEFARLFAYLFVVGDPYHMDGVHNDFLYEDPSTQHLHPIPWDVRFLDFSRPRQPLNRLFQAVLRDPFVIDATMREVARSIADDRIVKVVDSLATGVERRYAPYFEADRLRAGLIPDVGDGARSVAIVRGNANLLRSWLADDTVGVALTGGAGTRVVDLETRGMVGSDLTGFALEGRAGGAARLTLDRDRNGIADPTDPTVSLRETTADGKTVLALAQSVPLYPAWDATGRQLKSGTLAYRVFLSGVPAGATITPMLTNRITGAAAAQQPWGSGTTEVASASRHPWEFPAEKHQQYHLSGTVHLTESLVIPEGDTLFIEPGTTLLLDPEISIVSHGVMLARGTESRRIRVLPAVKGQPWGTFSLQGAGASGSIVSYAEIAEGGGQTLDRVEYIGMVNVHWARNVVFDHVLFRDNVRSDDTFHAMHSWVRVSNSHFLRANSDALDMDIATGEILNTTFELTGGDAIDLMTSTPRIIGNRISGSGDKGISIGEASRPFVFNNWIDSCDIGIEVKDRSEAVILNNQILRSRLGFRERRKNWRYGGGGWGTVAASEFAGNKTPRVRDVYSRITLLGTAGLDSAGTTEVAQPGDLTWLYAMGGVRPMSGEKVGPLSKWEAVTPVMPVDAQRFSDDFGEIADGWTGTGGVSRLEKRRDALVIEVTRRPGGVARQVNWELPQGGTLVVELAGRDLLPSTIRVTGDATLAAEYTANGDLNTAEFITLDLPPGHFTGLSVTLAPVPGLTRTSPKTGLTELRGGRIDLRGYLVMPAPAPALAAH